MPPKVTTWPGVSGYQKREGFTRTWSQVGNSGQGPRRFLLIRRCVFLGFGALPRGAVDWRGGEKTVIGKRQEGSCKGKSPRGGCLVG